MSGAFAQEFDAVEPMSSQPIPIRPPVPEAGEYPLDALSPKLQDAARAIVDKVQLPAAIAAQSVLAAAALGVQPYIDVILPTGERIPTSLFLISVAASGERKSSADKLAVYPVREREAELQRENIDVQARYIAEAAAFRAARKKAEAGNKTRRQIQDAIEACGDEPIAPPTPLLISDEGTLQGLQKLFAEAMPSLGLFSDEGGQWLGGYAMQEDNRVATGAALSKLWDGAPIKRVRGTDGFTILRGRRLSLHLMIQERIAKKLFGDADLASQGLLSRMLVCHPTSRKGERMWHDPAEDSRLALERYGARLFNLLRSPMPMDELTRELKPKELRLSDDARAMFIKWHDAVEVDLRRSGKFEKVSGFAAKLPEHSVRLAAVMAYFEDRNVEEISGKALAAGIKLAQFYAAEALRLFGIGGADEDSDAAVKIIEWLRAEKITVISKRLLGRHGPGRDMDGKARDRAVNLLLDMDHLARIPGAAEFQFKGKTERAREAFNVLPDEVEGEA
jgi:hypothetical protein